MAMPLKTQRHFLSPSQFTSQKVHPKKFARSLSSTPLDVATADIRHEPSTTYHSKSLQRQSRKCEKDEKAEKLKVKKAIEKGNMDGARMYAENAIRKRTEQVNYLRLASRLDAVVARLDTQAKMTTISKSMGSIVKSQESTLATSNLQKMSETVDQFEKQFVNMEVQAEFMESSMAGSTLSTPKGEVNSLMQQVANDYGLEVSVGLPQPTGHAVAVANKTEKVEEDDLSRRLAELKARG